MDIPSSPGVYRITHVPTGLFYVGSTSNLRSRIGEHRRRLTSNGHPNKRFQEAFTSLSDLDIVVTPLSSSEEAMKKEQEMLDREHGKPNCCNVSPNATSTGNNRASGHVVQDHVREAVRLANTGLKRSKETLERMSEAKSNQHIPVEIDGVRYKHAKDAAAKTGVPYGTVYYRANSDAECFSGWKFIREDTSLIK